MSETTEPDGKPEPEPEPTPTPGTGPSGAPESTPDTDEPGPAREAEEAGEKEDRRTAGLRARLGAADRDRAALRAENEFYRRQLQQQAPQDDTPEQAAQRMRLQIRAEVEADIRKETFHAQGQSQFTDWGQRCQGLMDMGADAQFAQLLVEMPGGEGVKVAGALAEDPEAVQRIANIQSPHLRAVALGKYAATLDADDGGQRAPRPAPQVTRAPAPIRPVTGRASPQFNEYTAPPEQLVDYYLKKDLERARGGSRR
jgi:hypothetical protein